MQAPDDEGDGPPPKKVPRRSCSPTHQQEWSTGSGAPEERQSEEVAGGSEGQASTSIQGATSAPEERQTEEVTEGQATTSPQSPPGNRPVVEGPEQQAFSAPVGQQYFVEITVDLSFLSYIHPQLTDQYENMISQMNQDPLHFHVSVSGTNLRVRMQSSDREALRFKATYLSFQLNLLKYTSDRLFPPAQDRPPAGGKA